MNVLIAATSAEAPPLVDALAELGCSSQVVGPDQDVTEAVARERPDVVVASLAGVGDPVAFARRVRAAVNPAPLVLLSDAGMEGILRPWADTVVLRALGAHAAARCAISAASGTTPTATPDLLEQLAAGIDELLDTEMLEEITRAAPRAALVTEDPQPEAPRSRGELSDEDMAALLGRLFTTAATGRLRLIRGDVEKTISLEAGRPVYAASSDPEDRLVAMLAREGQLSAVQQAEAIRTADATGKRMGALLVELGFLKPSELLVVVRRHYEELVLSLFTWTSGAWTFEPGLVASPERVRLLRHPAALVREGLDRIGGVERLRARLGSGRNVFRVLAGPGAADLLAEVLATDRERRLPGLFDGRRPLDDVARESHLPEESALKLAYTLWSFGLIVPAGAAPVRAGEERDRAVERARVLARHALALEGDYFQLLGIDRLADEAEVRRAYERLLRETSPSALDPAVAAELSSELATVAEALLEAARVLVHPNLRARYEAHLPDESATAASLPAAVRA
jgi:hypothetical protein